MTQSNSQIREYLNFLIVERGLSQNTILAYERDLAKFTSFNSIQDFSEITSPMLENYVSHLRSVGLSESSIVSDLIEATNRTDDPHSIRDRAIVELLYGTGARISEIVNLDLSGVSKIDGGEVLSVRLEGKGGKVRVVPLGRYAQDALDQYLVRARPGLIRKDRDALFLNDRGTRLSRQTMWKVVSEAAERAQLAVDVSPHALRHSYATHLLDGGADVRVVQELLGHSSVTTTQIYTLVTIDKIRESYSSAHPRARD